MAEATAGHSDPLDPSDSGLYTDGSHWDLFAELRALGAPIQEREDGGMQIGIEAPNDHSWSTINVPSTAEDRAKTEPTDKSIPPTTSTNVMPTAIKVRSGTWFAIDTNVAVRIKFSLNAPKITTSKASTASKPAYWTSERYACEFFMPSCQRVPKMLLA